ncbi:hypothetical protein [Mucilaginibacter psychrotolerans]|nr:hypothetical protein [Mucilaginibacter psychrotolerans]
MYRRIDSIGGFNAGLYAANVIALPGSTKAKAQFISKIRLHV